jgi:hypothetical protein
MRPKELTLGPGRAPVDELVDFFFDEKMTLGARKPDNGDLSGLHERGDGVLPLSQPHLDFPGCEQGRHDLPPRLGLAAILAYEFLEAIKSLIVRLCFSSDEIPNSQRMSIDHFGYVLNGQVVFSHILDEPFFCFVHYGLTSIYISQEKWRVKYFLLLFSKIY